MKCLVGFGSNLGDRFENLEGAAKRLCLLAPVSRFRVSPVYETTALVPPGAPDTWHIPFLNAVVEFEWEGSCEDLLTAIKQIESFMGRVSAERWAPRLIDMDILFFGDAKINTDTLKVPHPGVWERDFVLAPLREIAPTLRFPGKDETVFSRARKLCRNMPLWMGILNLTPDSFSDGGALADTGAFRQKVDAFEQSGVAFFDVGAESTRPGASEVSPSEEWARLLPALEFLKERYRDRIFRPRISVDTRRSYIAGKALECGANCINDVSGLSDPAMLRLLRESSCDIVLMHSLSVPADGKVTLSEECDVVGMAKTWAERRIVGLADVGIDPSRIIFDPGIGFGKTARQSLALLQGAETFLSLPVRILIGHSRKSFINAWGERRAGDRDWESVGISLRMSMRGMDILRVHEPQFHIRAHRAFQGARAWKT
ncbi:MAG: dihydropteroate synthase [Pseudomonadota bacterium]